MMPVQITTGFKHCGLFGTVRKHDIHTGLDFYCQVGAEVSCIQSGVVVDVFQFTGAKVGSPWWNTTYAVVVECGHLTFVYGELVPSVYLGQRLSVGDHIGNVSRVLKADKGVTPTSMLHLEVWLTDHYQKNHTWQLETEKPEGLLNPMEYV